MADQFHLPVLGGGGNPDPGHHLQSSPKVIPADSKHWTIAHPWTEAHGEGTELGVCREEGQENRIQMDPLGNFIEGSTGGSTRGIDMRDL